MDNDKIGKFIRNLRNEKNMSQTDLADLIPVTRQAVSKWEKGNTIPDSSTLKILSNIFDVSIDELLNGEKKENMSKKDLEEITLSIIDENVKKDKKLKRNLIIFISTMTVFLICFLIYYFITSYNSISVYKLGAIGNLFSMKDGIVISTKEKTYFRIGQIINDNNLHIENVKAYFYKNNEKIVFFDDTVTNYLIVDYYGYNEYFNYKQLETDLKKLYVEVTYDNGKTEEIKITAKKDFTNSQLVNIHEKNVGNNTNKNKLSQNIELKNIIEKIKEKGTKEENSYVIEKIIQDKNVRLTYFEMLKFLSLQIEDENSLKTWNYNFKSQETIEYSFGKNNGEIETATISLENYEYLSKKEIKIYEELINYIIKII